MQSIVEKQKDNTAKLAALREKMNSVTTTGLHKDSDGFFQLTVDGTTGEGGATIRFLPAGGSDDMPFLRVYNHAFVENGVWFIEGCPTTIGLECPVCESNTPLYNSGDAVYKAIAANRKRKMNYISNILVVSDPKNPANEGKVFLYKYGTRIFDKLRDLIAPPSDKSGIEPVDPFDVEEGPNFMLRVTKDGRYPDYQQSAFDQTLTSIGDEDKIAAVLSMRKSLSALVDPSQFKTYHAFKEKFEKMTGFRTPELDEKDFSPNLAASQIVRQ
jgi:gp32 DNA binding protein like